VCQYLLPPLFVICSLEFEGWVETYTMYGFNDKGGPYCHILEEEKKDRQAIQRGTVSNQNIYLSIQRGKHGSYP
jgi:hypothetical protein